MMQTIIRIALWLLTLASLVLAAVWSYNDPSFRSVLALLLAISAILGMFISSRGTGTTIIGSGNVTGSNSSAKLIEQEGGKNAIQVGEIGEGAAKNSNAKDAKTDKTESETHQELEIKGDGNVTGDGSSSKITRQKAGDSAIQIGEMSATGSSLADLLRSRKAD